MMYRKHQVVQLAAKNVLEELNEEITSTSTESSIAAFTAKRLSELGFPDTWYHSCQSLVLAGNRSCLSISGREYSPSDEVFGDENLITVDLSPCAGTVWGDCARSFAIESGVVTNNSKHPQFHCGFNAQTKLHKAMHGFASPSVSFHQLHEFVNDLISSMGFVNLDFLGNVGHSIVTSLEDRVYIEPGNHHELGSVHLFTFEPHIRHKTGIWGFKHENIYYFDESGAVAEL